MRIMLLLLVACSSATTPKPATSPRMAMMVPLTGAADCTTTAIPDDGIDDRQAIQDALSNKTCALLGPGVYDVVTPFPRTYGGNLDRYDMLELTGGRSLRGTGPGTTIRFSGNAGGSDVRGIGMTGAENLVSDLRFESAWTNSSEQTHIIQITGAAARQRVTGVWFQHPKPADRTTLGGDCIKVVGYDPDRRVSLIVDGNTFAACDRSGVAIHSGVSDATITGSLFLATGDQDIDLEGTGGAIDNIVVTGNVFRRTLNTGTSVSFGAGQTKRAVFSDNSVDGGKLYAYNVEALTVSGNTFNVQQQAIEMVKASKTVAISGNTFAATDVAASAGAMISCAPHGTGLPGSISITGNVFRTSTENGRIASLLSAADVTVSGNTMTWTAVTPTVAYPALIVYGIAQVTDSILVSGNTMRGPWARALQTTNSYAPGGGVAAVTFTGNIMRGVAAGLVCNQPGPGPFVVTGNSGAASSCSAPMGPGQ